MSKKSDNELPGDTRAPAQKEFAPALMPNGPWNHNKPKWIQLDGPGNQKFLENPLLQPDGSAVVEYFDLEEDLGDHFVIELEKEDGSTIVAGIEKQYLLDRLGEPLEVGTRIKATLTQHSKEPHLERVEGISFSLKEFPLPLELKS